MSAKKTNGKKVGKKVEAEPQNEESLKKIFDITLLKAKKITEKYDLKKAENVGYVMPKD